MKSGRTLGVGWCIPEFHLLMNPSLRRCVVLLQGFVFLHSVIDQTQVGDSPPPPPRCSGPPPPAVCRCSDCGAAVRTCFCVWWLSRELCLCVPELNLQLCSKMKSWHSHSYIQTHSGISKMHLKPLKALDLLSKFHISRQTSRESFVLISFQKITFWNATHFQRNR